MAIRKRWIREKKQWFNGRARQRPERQIARNTSRHSSAISDIIHARCFALNYHKSPWEDNKVSASNAPRARGSAPGGAFIARALHSRRPHLYAVAQERDGSFLHEVVHARFRWPFRAGGGWRRSCSNYSTHEGTHLRLHLHCHLHPGDIAARLCASRMQRPVRRQSAGGRTNDRLPTCASPRRLGFAHITLYISPPLLRRSAHRVRPTSQT